MEATTPTRLLHPVAEAVYLTGFGRSKLYELMETGEIEYVKVGSRRLIPHQSLERFVASLRGDGAPAA